MPFDGLASLYVVSVLFGLSQGGIVPSYAIIVREYLPAAGGRRSASASCIMATIVGMALGGWMSGWIFDLTGSYARRFPQRHRLEHAEHRGDGAAAVEIAALARSGGRLRQPTRSLRLDRFPVRSAS